MTSVNEWRGPVGDVWAREWRRTDLTFSGLSPHLDAAILAASPARGGTAIDVGCGAGQTSLALAAARPDLAITGIDVASGLIAIARERAEGLANLSFVAGDVRELLQDHAPVDLLFSRHGVMFFEDPVAGFAALHRAVAPNGRIVFSCFREAPLNGWAGELIEAVTGNAFKLASGYAPGPFAFADPDFVIATLTAAGWQGIEYEAVDFGYRAGRGEDPVADALECFRSIGPTAPLLRAAPPDQRSAVLERFAEVVARHRHGDVVEFPAAAWIWKAQA